MTAIPEKYLDLFQKKAFAQLATIMPDGTPQVSPVWVEYDGKHIVINSAKGRVKDRNMRRDPRVGLDLQDPDNPYRHLSIRGRVTEITLPRKSFTSIFLKGAAGSMYSTYQVSGCTPPSLLSE